MLSILIPFIFIIWIGIVLWFGITIGQESLLAHIIFVIALWVSLIIGIPFVVMLMIEFS